MNCKSTKTPKCPYFLWIFLFLAVTHGFAQKQHAVETVRRFANSNLEKLSLRAGDVQNLTVTHDYVDASTGIEHIYATQKINGLSVTGSNLSLHTKGARVIESNNLVPITSYSVRPITTSITSLHAVQAILIDNKVVSSTAPTLKQAAKGTDQVTIYKRNASPIFDIPTRLVYYNNERLKVLQPAWEVQMMEEGRKHFWLAYIDATTGKILEKRDLIVNCDFGGGVTDDGLNDHNAHNHTIAQDIYQPKNINKFERFFEGNAIPDNKYRVYDLPLESPGDTIEQAAPHVFGSKSGSDPASPDGWHKVANAVTYQYTRGNNVWSFQDPSPGPLGGVPSADPTRTAYANNGPGGTPPATEPFIFDYPINLANDPSTYQNGAIVNLFYWNNLMHDVFYNLGFTEAAGNFEDSHIFSTGIKAGGRPEDAVLAQAQDGGGTNNANFLTTPDGTPGQMQMYLWTAAFPDSLVQIVLSSTGIPPAGKKYFAVQGSFNTNPTANTNLFTNPRENKQFIIVKKNPLSVVGSDEEGCSTGQQSIALPPGNDVTDKIVLIRRGSCSFAEKVLGAQEGGAAGVIVINNVDGPPLAMGGADVPGNTITIPAVMISKADGEVLLTQLRAGATITGSLKRNTPPAPKRDGDIDNGVIAHEYGHGISSRLTAPNTLGPLGGGEQGGEGWSDYMALYMTLRTNDLAPATATHPNGVLPIRSIGNYVTYQPANGRGIRPTPYSIDRAINSSTFKTIGKGGEISVPHGVGYVWCTMMYEMLQGFIDQYGMGDDVYVGAAPVNNNPPASAKGNNIAMRLILEGIKLQGTSPTFERQRNAILKADTLLYNAQHSCMIWKAFASRGLGASAKSNTNGVGDEVEAFDVPLSCNSNQKRVSIVKTGPVKLVNGGAAVYTVNVTNKYAVPVANVTITDTLPSTLTFNSASDGGTLTGNVVKWIASFAASETKTFTLNTTVNTPGASTEIFSDDHEAGPTNWVAANNGGVTNWTYTDNAAKAYSGSKFWFAPNTETPPGTNTTLRSANTISIPTGAELVFIHKYSTEPKYDGGVLEISLDNITWTYVPPTKFVRGGYNDIIPTTNNPAIGASNLAAFTGTSPGYIVSIVNLDEYANKNIYVRFRFTCDQTGGTVDNEGWYMDDIYVIQNRTEIANSANALTTPDDPIYPNEGSNARSTSSAFVLGGTVLPNSLGALSAALNRQNVTLQWNTYNELNAAYFTIERKGTNEQNFVSIGTVNAAGTGTLSRTYSFTDGSVIMGNRYQYRIKLVNRSGEFYYTNIALVSIGGKNFAATIYPNPAGTIANLSIENPSSGKVVINLYDGLGKKLATLNGAEGTNQVIALPVSRLQPGTYWVEVNTIDNKKTLKLVVNR